MWWVFRNLASKLARWVQILSRDAEVQRRAPPILLENRRKSRFFAPAGHFVALETIFAVLQTLWKHHNSKEHKFLHRNYIQIFFSTPTKMFFRVQNFWIFFLNFFEHNLKKTEIENDHFLKSENDDFWNRILKKFRIFVTFFPKNIFSKNELEKIFFRSWEFSLGYSFDVKKYNLSIYEVFRAFGPRQTCSPAPTKCSTDAKIRFWMIFEQYWWGSALHFGASGSKSGISGPTLRSDL